MIEFDETIKKIEGDVLTLKRRMARQISKFDHDISSKIAELRELIAQKLVVDVVLPYCETSHSIPGKVHLQRIKQCVELKNRIKYPSDKDLAAIGLSGKAAHKKFTNYCAAGKWHPVLKEILYMDYCAFSSMVDKLGRYNCMDHNPVPMYEIAFASAKSDGNGKITEEHLKRAASECGLPYYKPRKHVHDDK